ncbi:hypothetical protein HanRHA438_Chr11g0492271 [Helianthus annuus]|nr:hypothetical protein HanRHA438_Chr11g0492271 [Helianthus annuus]
MIIGSTLLSLCDHRSKLFIIYRYVYSMNQCILPGSLVPSKDHLLFELMISSKTPNTPHVHSI